MKRALAVVLLALTARAGADPLRDPMRPPRPVAAHATRAEEVPTLSGVFAAGAERRAIVNGRVVRAGEVVDGYAIEEVYVNGVRYRRAGTVRETYLPNGASPVKKPTAATARVASGGQ